MTDRRQRVVMDGCASEWKTVPSRVPQGSILGPLMFILYIDDLPSVPPHTWVQYSRLLLNKAHTLTYML